MTPQHRHRAELDVDTQPNLPRVGPPTEVPPPSPPPPRRSVDLVAPVRRWLGHLGGQATGGRRSFRVGVIVSSFVIVLLAVVVVSYRAATNAGAGGSDTPGSTTHHITYDATSTGKTVIVTFTQGDNGLDGQTTAPSPWTMTTTTTASVAVLTVTTNNTDHPDRTDSVTCAIVDAVTGRTLVSNSVLPSVGASVTCVTGNLRN